MSAPLLAPCTCVSDCGDCPGVQHGLRQPCAVYITSENKRRLHDAAPELLAVAREAVRIDKARLILADGIDDNGQPFTEAQRSDAKAFLANRSAAWLHEAVAAITKATGSAS